MKSASSHLSTVSLCCPVVILAVGYFLTTPEAQRFNEQLFGRFYTLGAILMIGLYSTIFIGLFVLGVSTGFKAWRRKETPSWMPKLAIAANVLLPVALIFYQGYFGKH